MRLLVVERTANYLIYFINEDTEYKQGKVLIQGHTRVIGRVGSTIQIYHVLASPGTFHHTLCYLLQVLMLSKTLKKLTLYHLLLF